MTNLIADWLILAGDELIINLLTFEGTFKNSYPNVKTAAVV